jgi:hypothetical protein
MSRRDAFKRTALFIVGLITVGLTMAPPVRGDEITDVKQLAGKWKGDVVLNARSFDADLTIKEDGTYEGVAHLGIQRSRGSGSRVVDSNFGGAIQIANGKASFKHTTGRTGVITMDGRKMKWVGDDGAGASEWEPVK